MQPTYRVAAAGLRVRDQPRADAAELLVLPHGTRLHDVTPAAPGWVQVSVNTAMGPWQGYVERRFLADGLSMANPPFLHLANRRMFDLAEWAIAHRVGYRFGAKAEGLTDRPPAIDCSGWVAFLLAEAFAMENGAEGEKAFDAADIAAITTYSDRQVCEVERRTGERLAGAAFAPDRLQPGWVIGLNSGMHPWEMAVERRYGIDHVAIVLANPRPAEGRLFGPLYVCQSAGGSATVPRGVSLTPLARWLDHHRGPIAAGSVHAVNPMAMADPFAQPASLGLPIPA